MMKNLKAVAIAAAALIACAGIALAQATAPDTTVRFDGLFAEMRPLITEAVSILIGAAVLWAAKKIHDLTGINIESKHREALQSALKNGAKLVIDRAQDAAGNLTIDVQSVRAAAAINYVLESVPDAVAYFGLDEARLRELLEPRLIEARAQIAAPAAAAKTAEVVVTVADDGKIAAAPASPSPSSRLG